MSIIVWTCEVCGYSCNVNLGGVKKPCSYCELKDAMKSMEHPYDLSNSELYPEESEVFCD